MYTLKTSSSGTNLTLSELLHGGPRPERPGTAHWSARQARRRGQVQTQANMREWSGVRGMVPEGTRRGRKGGRTGRPEVQAVPARPLSAVLKAFLTAFRVRCARTREVLRLVVEVLFF